MSIKFCEHGRQEATCPFCNDKEGKYCDCEIPAFATLPTIYTLGICKKCGRPIPDGNSSSNYPDLEKEIKPKMLFVDDRKKRIHYALENFSDKFEVTIAPCVPEALREMSAQDWDVISLDHDLNGHDFQDPDTPSCGMEIVRYIAKTGWPPQRKKPEFWIHSSNLFAAHLMTVSLTEIGMDAWYKPIIYNVEHMEYDEKGIALP